MKSRSLKGAVSIGLILVVAALLGLVALTQARTSRRTDRALSAGETATVRDAVALMQKRGLPEEAALASRLLGQGFWRAATAADPYLKASEKAGDTPFAYTLSSGRHPSAIVLAPRFFTETTPTGRAALMVHEMGHYRAYVQTGKSDEYDGYKAEYDTHAKLGLGEQDGLVYFALLDGVVEYVVPRLPSYKTRPDVQSYIQQSSGTP